MSSEEILENMNVKSFTKGGITVTGGEPLLQMDFLIEFFTKCKEKGIHVV